MAAKALMGELADTKQQLATARSFESHLGNAETALELIADESIGQDPGRAAHDLTDGSRCTSVPGHTRLAATIQRITGSAFLSWLYSRVSLKPRCSMNHPT